MKLIKIMVGTVIFIILNTILVNTIWDYDGPVEIAAIVAMFLVSAVFYGSFSVERQSVERASIAGALLFSSFCMRKIYSICNR